MPKPPQALKTFDALLEVISALRGPEGCPWDKKQTHQTLSSYAVEETHELVEAIEHKNDEMMQEELGDVLFQVILHAQLAQERKAFDIFDVIEGINAKIIRRHPHVFADLKISSEDDILTNWDRIKTEEKKKKKQNSQKNITEVLQLPDSLPSLQKAFKIGEKTEKLQFDWTTTQDVLTHLKSEIQELEEAIAQQKNPTDLKPIEHELGDVLFTAAQLARHLQTEPESCLRQANRRFTERFHGMLNLLKDELSQKKKDFQIESFSNLSASEKEQLWKKIKTLESK